jgi:hypothetical protein
MKHAYLVMAHNEPELLKTLLSVLDDERNDIYLHIDARAVDLYNQFLSFRMEKGNLILLEQRIAVHWGDISQVEVEYDLFEAAFRKGPYGYYHLLSGVDLPIKSQDYIHAFFKQHAGKEFVGFWIGEGHRKDVYRKVYRYYLFTRYFKEGSVVIHGFTAFVRNVFLALQKVTRFKRKHDYEFCKGFNWVSITNDFCRYLIENKDNVMHTFKYTLCPDEIFIQTLIWNSPFRANIYDSSDVLNGSMRAIDWQRGSPYVWKESDMEELRTSPYLFARKFSSAYPVDIEKLVD